MSYSFEKACPVPGLCFYFHPDIAVIFVYLGNDFKNSFSKIQTHLRPGNYITVPIFPEEFYEIHLANTKTWSLAFDEHDFLLPEKKLVDFARENKMNILPMGRYIKEQGLAPGEIMQIYINGTGHWSASGHQFFAEAVYSYLTSPYNLRGGSHRAAAPPLIPLALHSTR